MSNLLRILGYTGPATHCADDSWNLLRQVREMRGRLACASLHFSWDEHEGRAVDVLACALKQRKLGQPLKIHMDWGSCLFHCDEP